MKKYISTNSPSEKKVGYSRAVIVNDRAYVSGTTSINEKGKVVGTTVGDQTIYIFQKIEDALNQGGFSRSDIVDMTVYFVRMEKLPEFDTAFKEYFFNIKPCCTLVGISALVEPQLFIEISCIAERDLQTS